MTRAEDLERCRDTRNGLVSARLSALEAGNEEWADKLLKKIREVSEEIKALQERDEADAKGAGES